MEGKCKVGEEGDGNMLFPSVNLPLSSTVEMAATAVVFSGGMRNSGDFQCP